MKSSIKAALAGAALAVALVGCNATTPDLSAEFGKVDGGWNVPEENVVVLNDDEAAIFADAIEGLTGVGYEPIAVVATQVVAGTNRAFLCKGTLVTPEGGTGWYIVTIYTNLEGVSEILSIKELDCENPLIAESDDTGDIVGGWTIVEPVGDVLPADAAEVYASATEDLGARYTPIALLGSQLESGTNYMVLAYGEMAVANPRGGLYLMQLSSSGGGSINSVMYGQLDFLQYV